MIKVSNGVWLEDTFDGENIRMVQKSHDFKLTKCSQRKNFVFERFINLLYSNEARLALSCVCKVLCSDDNSVSARAYQLNNFIGVRDLETRTEQIVCLVSGSPIYIVHYLLDLRLLFLLNHFWEAFLLFMRSITTFKNITCNIMKTKF